MLNTIIIMQNALRLNYNALESKYTPSLCKHLIVMPTKICMLL